jgi:hypothetical protein
MNFDLFRLHQTQFHRDFAIRLDIESRILKLDDEMLEFLENPCVDEALDVMNVVVSVLCDCYGVKDPLLRGCLKLEETARKYKKLEETSLPPA